MKTQEYHLGPRAYKLCKGFMSVFFVTTSCHDRSATGEGQCGTSEAEREGQVARTGECELVRKLIA